MDCRGGLDAGTWQELEELTLAALEAHGYACEFRRVFKTPRGRREIDIIARKPGQVLAVDCKRYMKTRSRRSALRAEAEKHSRKCSEYSSAFDETAVAVIVTYLDDALLFTNGCVVVPLRGFNDFLLNSSDYLHAFH